MTAPFKDIRDFGAAGDGAAKDTAAIQRAIDECNAEGGGTVLVSAGIFLTGTLYLKSHVELRLSPGATLLGSPDKEDYNRDDDFPESAPNVSERASGAHLIVAYRQDNVAVTGQGTINGNAPCFFEPLEMDPSQTYRCRAQIRDVAAWRPGQMLWFCRCSRVAVRDVKLVDPPYWSLLLLGCEDVQVRGVTCVNTPISRNGDGIDIDCSRNVTVSDCVMRTGDDCLTLRGNVRRLGDEPSVCENVTVTNCVFSTPTCAIRVGVGDGTIRRCSFSNIVVAEARTGVCVTSCYRASKTSRHGVHIEQVHFSDFTMDCVLPIVMTIGPDARPGAAIQDISFDRFRIVGFGGSQMIGREGMPIRRVRLSNFEWLLRGGTENREFRDRKPDVFPVDGFKAFAGQTGLPSALYAVRIEDCVFDDLRIRWEEPSAVWRDGIYIEESRGLDFRDVTLAQPSEDGAAIHLCAVEDVRGRGCRASPGAARFLRIEDCLRPESIRFD